VDLFNFKRVLKYFYTHEQLFFIEKIKSINFKYNFKINKDFLLKELFIG
jgi:hypothetical protein